MTRAPATAASTAIGSRASLIVAANGVSITGSALNLIALLTRLYGGNGGALSVGGVVLVSFLPVAIAMPLIGRRLAPRSPRQMLVAVPAGQAMIAGVMAAESTTAHAHLAVLYPAAAALGLGAMMTRLATYTVLPRLIPRDSLPRANLSLQISSQAGAAVGALIVVLASHSPAWALFTADAATFMLQAAAFAVALSGPLSGQDEPRAGNAQPVPEQENGTSASSRPLPERAAFFLAIAPAGYIALNAVNVALPLVALGRLAAGQRGFAAGEFVYPLAAISCGLAARYRRPPPLSVCIAMIAAGMLLLAWSTGLATLLVAVIAVGGGNVLSNAVSQSLLQRNFRGSALGSIQGRAAGVGAAVSCPVVLGIAWAFEHRAGWLALVVVGCCFVALAAVAMLAHDERTNRAERGHAAH